MIKKLGAAAQTALANTLNTNINTQIDAVAAAWNDGIPLPHITNIYAGYRTVIGEYPAIVVNAQKGKQTANGASLWAEIDHIVEITVIVQADDAPTLDAQIQRYLVAIWQVLMQNQQLDGSLSGLAGVDPMEYGRSGMYPLEKSTLLMEAAAWSVTVHVIESV